MSRCLIIKATLMKTRQHRQKAVLMLPDLTQAIQYGNIFIKHEPLKNIGKLNNITDIQNGKQACFFFFGSPFEL